MFFSVLLFHIVQHHTARNQQNSDQLRGGQKRDNGFSSVVGTQKLNQEAPHAIGNHIKLQIIGLSTQDTAGKPPKQGKQEQRLQQLRRQGITVSDHLVLIVDQLEGKRVPCFGFTDDSVTASCHQASEASEPVRDGDGTRGNVRYTEELTFCIVGNGSSAVCITTADKVNQKKGRGTAQQTAVKGCAGNFKLTGINPMVNALHQHGAPVTHHYGGKRTE